MKSDFDGGVKGPAIPRLLPVTEFVLPDGRSREITAPVTEEVARLGELVIAEGFRFEAEVLTTGLVSIDCCNAEDQLAIHVGPNDESVHAGMEAVVRNAAQALNITTPTPERADG